jgi:hypothetical protein
MHYYKFVKVIYAKITYKNTVLLMRIYKLTYNFIYLHKLKNKIFQTKL